MPSGIGPGGISIYRRFFLSLILSLVIIISVFSIPVSALHTLSGENYSTLLAYRQNGCPTIQINYSQPFSIYTDAYPNEGVYDVNCIFIVCPGYYYTIGGYRYYTTHSVSGQTMHEADFDIVSLFNSNEITCDYDSGTSLDSMFTYLTFTLPSNALPVAHLELLIGYGYYNNGGSFAVDDVSCSLIQENVLNLPYSESPSQFLINAQGYQVANRAYINLGPSYKIAHNISDIDVSEGISSDISSGDGDECGCSNCCDCDCGYYTEQLQQNLIDYFDQNYITQEMFETYMEENVINNNTVNNDYTIINSMVSDTSFSADIESFVGDQDALFSDLNGYGSQLDNFESQLTISPEVSQAAGFLSGAFGSLPPSLIGALVFVLVMLVVVKILGR